MASKSAYPVTTITGGQPAVSAVVSMYVDDSGIAQPQPTPAAMAQMFSQASSPQSNSQTAAGTFTPGSGSYALGQIVGRTGAGLALIEVQLTPSTTYSFERAALFAPMAASTAIGALQVMLWAVQPSATLTDAAIPTLTAPDAAAMTDCLSLSAGAFAALGTIGAWSGSRSPGVVFTTGVSGKVWIAFAAAAAQTWATPGVATWVCQFRK